MEKNDLVPTKVVEADSWKIELGDVHNKHKEFIKGIEKALVSFNTKNAPMAIVALALFRFLLGCWSLL